MAANNSQKPKHRWQFMLVTYGILLYLGLTHFPSIKGAFVWIFAIMQPVVYGICIAFIINLFMNFFHKKVFKAMAASDSAVERKISGFLSGFCTALVAAVILSLVILLIIPQLTSAINMLIEKAPGSEQQLRALIIGKLTEWNAPAFMFDYVNNFKTDWNSLLDYASNLLDGKVESMLGKAFNATTTVLSTATNLVLGLIIAIYILAQKSRVLYLLRKFIRLIVPDKYEPQAFRVLSLTNKSFANFLSGQFVEAIIIGSLCAVGLAIFRFPFPGTIGILTGITALLPIVGAWIGGAVGCLLVWVEAPSRAIWFLVFILVLQQLENQLIYPRVVGNSVGLPGLLVLIAVVLGGGIGGVMGIMFAVPLLAIGYTLLKEKLDRIPDEAPADDTPPEDAPDNTDDTDNPEPEDTEDAADPEPDSTEDPDETEDSDVPPPPRPRPNQKRKKRRRRR